MQYVTRLSEFVSLTLIVVMAQIFVVPAAATEAAWARILTGGYSILLTHTDAPGFGDPPFFDIDDCTTQRQLSDRGLQQARKMGVRFAARAINISAVYSSRYCRAVDTAEGAFSRIEINALPFLDLLQETTETEQLTETVKLISTFRGPGNQVIITHPENVQALTGATPRVGEALIVTAAEDEEKPRVIARLLLN